MMPPKEAWPVPKAGKARRVAVGGNVPHRRIAGAERDQNDARVAREGARKTNRDAVGVERGRRTEDGDLAAVDAGGMEIVSEVLDGAHRHTDQLGRCRRRRRWRAVVIAVAAQAAVLRP